MSVNTTHPRLPPDFPWTVFCVAFSRPLHHLYVGLVRRALKETGKTVVLATNQLYFVQSADLVLYVSDGRIAESGPFPRLMAAGGQFTAMMKEVQVHEAERALEAAHSLMAAVPTSSSSGGGGADSLGGGGGAVVSKVVTRLVTDEASSQGAIGADVMLAYIEAMGGRFSFFLLAVGYVGVEGVRVATTVWLSLWTGSTDAGGQGGEHNHSAMFYLVSVLSFPV